MDIKKFCFSVLFCAAVLNSQAADYELPPPENDTYIYYSADYLNYDNQGRILSLDGDVNVVFVDPQYPETKMFTQNLTLDQNQKSVYSQGDVRIEQGSAVMTGRDFFYNYQSRELEIKGISADYPPIRLMDAESAQMKDGKQIFKSAKITCCDVEDPHYYIKLGHVSMNEKKRIFGYNGLLYIGNVPVFYLPVFWRSLDSQKPWTTYVDFTQSSKTGFGLLTSTVFQPTNYLRGIINLDGYTQAGFGYGAQLMVVNSEDVKANVEAYAIDDNEYEKYRWGVNGGLRALIADTSERLEKEDGAMYQSQGQFRAVSDPYFNDTYFRSNPYKFMPDQDVNFSFSRQSRSSIMRASYSQKDIFNRDTEKYEVAERVLPKIEYQLMPVTGPFKIVSTFHANFNNTEEFSDGYVQTAGAEWRSSRAFKVNKKMTFTPYILADERIVFNDSNYDDDNSYVTRLGTGANLRAKLITGDLDISYSYLKRFKTNSLESDDSATDKGDEDSLIYVQNHFIPFSNTYFRIGTGYDLRDSAGTWDLDERLEPLLTEAGFYTSNGKANLFVRNLYDFKDGNQSFVMQGDVSVLKKSRIALGMTNHSNDINSYIINTKLWFRPSGHTWYVDGGMDFEIKQGGLSAFSKSINIYKNFHDANIMFGVEDRNQNLSFRFRINVLCGSKTRVDTFKEEDRYWTPWREAGDLR
ncbi:LPS-assembly protein [Elusimicrobium posterum]|uniref:LPS export ABC transporter periplasmic protein LptC n=1 Tax=Elusimicrobium posterum TaxID=3116653 RepID=UPI003C7426B5